MKLRIINTALSLVLCCLGSAAATVKASSRYLKRTVETGSFKEIVNNTSLDITYKVGPQKIEICAPDNLIDYIDVSAKNGQLKITYTESMSVSFDGRKKELGISISAPAVTRFVTNSAGDLKIATPIVRNDQNLTFMLNSSGDFDAGRIQGREVEIVTNSAGDISVDDVKGEIVRISTNSAGDIDIETVSAKKNLSVMTNSAGDIDIEDIAAGERISLMTNSAGDMEIGRASADEISVAVNSSGDAEVSGIKAKTVSAASTSVGEVSLSGNCESLSLSCKRSKVDARKLKANDVKFSLYGSGTIYCLPIRSLTGTTSGKGKVKYAGNPAEINVTGNGVSPL